MDGYYQPCTVLPSLLIPTGRKHSNEASHDRDRRQPGIGAAVAALAATRGYAVCVNYKSRADRAQAVVDAIRGQGGTAVAVGADVSTEAGILALFSATDRELGPVAALVNNAGILETQMRVEQMDAARLQRIMQANVVGLPVRPRGGAPDVRGTAARAASSSMCPRPPRACSPGEYVDYAASKGALDTMTIGLAKEVGAEGIRVNAVRPGSIYTEIHASGGEPDRVDRVAARVPMGRGGRVEEIAAAVLWLCSDEATYANGAILDVSGGI